MLSRKDISAFIVRYKNQELLGWPEPFGLRGNSFLSTGFVYAPYIPQQVISTTFSASFSASNFTPRKGIMTRYSKAILSSSYYGTVTIGSGSSPPSGTSSKK